MKYVTLDYDQAHKVEETNHFLSWNGYDIVTHRRSANGYSDKRGVFRDGEWWLQFRYPMTDKGLWKVPEIYVSN
jgi:hypothetical protein